MRRQDPNTHVVPKMEGATYAYFRMTKRTPPPKKKKIIIITTEMKTLTESHICLYELHNHLKSLLRQQIHRINRAPPQAEN